MVISWILKVVFIWWAVVNENECRHMESSRYDTAYACEGKTLQLRCGQNEVIHLIRANYGRFSITICNDQGNTDWSVNCMSGKSLRVLYSRCSLRQSCSVPASTSLFGDLCPGTFKYLEAHFNCIPATMSTTTVRPSPPWLLTSQPNVWSTAKVSTVRPPVLTGLPPRTKPTRIITTVPSTTEMIDTTTFDEDVVTTQIAVVSLPHEEFWNEEDMCSPEYARGLKWNWTKSGEFAVQPCPGGASGVARWRCLEGVPPSRPRSPDLSECRSLWLAGLDLRISEGDEVTSIAYDLSQVTDSKPLFGGDLMTTTEIIKKLAKKMALNIQTYPDQRQREAIVTELLQGIIKTSSNLLDMSQLASWRDLSHKEQMRVATSLLVGIEENSFLLADTVVREKTVVHSERNIFLHVRVLESQHIDDEIFSCGNNDEANINWEEYDNWLKLDKRSLIENRSEGDLLRVVYAAFDRLEEILVPLSRGNVSRIVNSKVISASLGKGRHIQLSEPVTLCLKHVRTVNVSNPSCVFWDYTASAWSEEGCTVESTNRTHTICSCNHLTNFALLMDITSSNAFVHKITADKIIIYVGCAISIITLLLSISTFLLFKSLKSDRTAIHCNLCFCLLAAELLFVFGIDRVEYSVVCGVVAGLLHYFLLCSFVWLFFEGFQLYIIFLEVINVDKRMLWYYLLSYCFPLTVVSVSILIDPFSYGTDKYCWLKADNFFIFSFVGPVIAVILANIIFLSLAIYMMCRVGGRKQDVRLGSSVSRLRGAIVLVFIVGLTWTFGLLYLNQDGYNSVVAFIFGILNGCQGPFVFIFHCLSDETVRREYVKSLSKWFKCVEYKEEEVGADKEPTYTIQNKAESTSQADGREDHCRTSPRPSTFSESDPKTPSTWGHHLNRPFVWKNGNFEAPSPKFEGVTPPKLSFNEVSTPLDEETIKSAAVLSDTLKKSNYSMYTCQYPQSASVMSVTGRQRKRSRNGSLRHNSPWNHTYTEINDRRQDDPVYEEIERERHFLPPAEIRNSSDLSDDEFRRISDMSRQSSRSYGDHRPLIPYSPGTDRNFHSALDAAFRQRLKEQATKAQHQQSTIAVLDGETVVCHLQPDSQPSHHC